MKTETFTTKEKLENAITVRERQLMDLRKAHFDKRQRELANKIERNLWRLKQKLEEWGKS